MKTIHELLKIKGSEVYSVAPGILVKDALKLMAEKDIGALLVMEKGKLLGIFSERDYARKVYLVGKHCKDTAVENYMTREVHYLPPHTPIYKCMELMTEKKIRHVPVMDSGEVVGMITIGDVVKSVIGDLETTVNDLYKYISGTRI